jgi:hypothetical protein
VYDRFVGRADPVDSRSRYPVLYMRDEADRSLCRCGCGQAVERGEFALGHDTRAAFSRISNDFGGSVSRFLDWYDAQRGRSGFAT